MTFSKIGTSTSWKTGMHKFVYYCLYGEGLEGNIKNKKLPNYLLIDSKKTPVLLIVKLICFSLSLSGENVRK